MVRLLPLLMVLGPGAALAQPVLVEVLREDADQRLRLRYVWPELVPDAAADLARDLCRRDAVAGSAGAGDGWEVVVSISDVAVPFGQSAPDAVQIFEGFTRSGDDCIWSNF